MVAHCHLAGKERARERPPDLRESEFPDNPQGCLWASKAAVSMLKGLQRPPGPHCAPWVSLPSRQPADGHPGCAPVFLCVCLGRCSLLLVMSPSLNKRCVSFYCWGCYLLPLLLQERSRSDAGSLAWAEGGILFFPGAVSSPLPPLDKVEVLTVQEPHLHSVCGLLAARLRRAAPTPPHRLSFCAHLSPAGC